MCLLNRFYFRRGSSSRRENEQCTEPTGLAVNDSSPVNDSGFRSTEPTRDSSKRIRPCMQFTPYSGLASQRLDFSFGRPRSYDSGRSSADNRRIKDYCNQFYLSIRSKFPAVRGPEELEIQEESTVDWPFASPVEADDWKQFFLFMYTCAKHVGDLQ